MLLAHSGKMRAAAAIANAAVSPGRHQSLALFFESCGGESNGGGSGSGSGSSDSILSALQLRGLPASAAFSLALRSAALSHLVAFASSGPAALRALRAADASTSAARGGSGGGRQGMGRNGYGGGGRDGSASLRRLALFLGSARADPELLRKHSLSAEIVAQALKRLTKECTAAGRAADAAFVGALAGAL